MEDELGTIETGKIGDLVVPDKDYHTVSDEDLKRINPILAVLGGKIAYDAGVVTTGRSAQSA